MGLTDRVNQLPFPGETIIKYNRVEDLKQQTDFLFGGLMV